MCGRIIIVKKKHRIATRHPTEVRGEVIIVIIIRRRNGAKTISLQTLFGRLNYYILIFFQFKKGSKNTK